MQRLRDISEHRVIARHVQQIVWNIRVIKKPPRSPQLFKREFGYSVPEADENARYFIICKYSLLLTDRL